VSIINHEESRAKIEDLDIAESAAKIASARIVKSASIAALSKAMEMPKSAIKLLEKL
jgi:flagellin-like hook-associated protein FlgL